MRRGAGVVERGGLENRCTSNSTVGSNPTLSATIMRYDFIEAHFSTSKNKFCDLT